MITAVCVTLPPALFLTTLFAGGERFKRRNLDMDGDPPINRTLFYASKYAIVVLWGTMVAQGWGAGLSFVSVPAPVEWLAMSLWVAGFTVLFLGRFELGDSFRIGSPKERTALKAGGLFRVSRNPMYLGVFATVLAPACYTLNPAVLIAAVFIIAVHHRIVLAEEEYLQRAFGGAYADYCRRVRRYI
jgi:protein-S-isoprenylcysteine O-methyltransferase Ste14